MLRRALLALAAICLTRTGRLVAADPSAAGADVYVAGEPAQTAPASAPAPAAVQSALGPAAGSRLLLVTTLDGRLSALDTAADGRLLWSVQAREEGMLRSTLTQSLQLSQQGQWVRLIPSLDGRLFSYDGDQVEPLPVTAETLLHASYRFADDMVIVGGSEVVTLGIDQRTGRLRYRCAAAGCARFGADEQDADAQGTDAQGADDGDVIVLRQHTQTVRAVEPRSGQERWNFSVSRHEVALSAGSVASAADPPPVDGLLTASLAEGELSGVERGRRWQHRFSHPLVHVWRLDGGRLHEVDLLAPTGGDDPATMRPLLYLGVHQQQLYIQQSGRAAVAGTAPRLAVAAAARMPPVVKWRPYMVSASSRTPVIHGTTRRHDNRLLLGHAGAATALAPWPGEYPYEGGYYLYSSDCELPLPADRHGPFPNPQQPADDYESFDDSVVSVVATSLSYWWPQILLLSASIAVLLNLLVTEHYRLYYRGKALRAVRAVLHMHLPRTVVREVPVPVPVRQEVIIREVVKEVVRDPPPVEQPRSRFLEDFEPIQCLGKGGFGVVFEARNKLDSHSYAVKRIRLPGRERARRKVLREVSCLAKLEHRNIVRYFYCWTEKLSAECLLEQDRVLESSEWVSSRTPLNSLEGAESAPGSPDADLSGSVLRKTRFASALLGDAEDWRLRTLGGGFLPTLDELAADESARSAAGDDSIVFSGVVADTDSSGRFSVQDSAELAEARSRTGPDRRRLDDSLLSSRSGDSVVFAAESGQPVVDYTLPEPSDADSNSDTSASGPLVAFQTNHSPLHDASSFWDDDDDGGDDEPAALPVHLFIQMQLCRKESLKDWLNANCGSRSTSHVLAIFRQILNGVEYVHSQRLMHRDLKPSNIFFSLDGTVKIGDFGLATTLSAEPAGHTPAASTSHVDGRHTDQVGTQLYMSPEQVLGHPYDAKVDIYSLGIILFELLVPFATQMERQRTLTLVRRLVFPEPFQRRQPDEHTLLAQMLCHQPARRPAIVEIRRSVARCRAASRGGALLEDELDSTMLDSTGLSLATLGPRWGDSDLSDSAGLDSTGAMLVGSDRSEPDASGLVATTPDSSEQDSALPDSAGNSVEPPHSRLYLAGLGSSDSEG